MNLKGKFVGNGQKFEFIGIVLKYKIMKRLEEEISAGARERN